MRRRLVLLALLLGVAAAGCSSAEKKKKDEEPVGAAQPSRWEVPRIIGADDWWGKGEMAEFER